MKGQYKFFRNSRPIAEVAIVGFVFATLFCKFDLTAQGCSLLDKAAWVALVVLRPVILTAWQSVPVCLCADSSFFRHLLQIAASIWPLLCVIAG